MEKIIELKNINKSFKDKVLFKNFSEIIYKGEMVAITGDSGTGKTTLINIISGLEFADSGCVEIFGEKINKNNKQKFYLNKISFLFQNFALIDDLTVKENLKLVCKIKNRSVDDIPKVLEKLGLSNIQNNKVYTLSGGEQQRVALARLILQDNELILADEPTGSLDENNRDVIFSIL